MLSRQPGVNKANIVNLVEEEKVTSILPHKGKHLVVKVLKDILIEACATLTKKSRELFEVSGKSHLSLDLFGCIAISLHT